MGPYVLRSVNAHFKLWDDGVQDSFRENITQANINDLPPINATCNCTQSAGTCGNPTDPNSQCAPGQRGYTVTCDTNSVMGCSTLPNFVCLSDPSCCAQYYQQGCGTAALGNPPTVPSGTSCPTTTNTVSPPYNHTNLPAGGACSPAATGTTNNCYYGQRIWSTLCPNPQIECVNDNNCAPQCPQLPMGSLFCSGTDSGLSQSYTNLTYVGAVSKGCTAPCSAYCPALAAQSTEKCVVFCDASQDYFLNPSGTGCTNEITLAPVLEDCSTVKDQKGNQLPGCTISSDGSASPTPCCSSSNNITVYNPGINGLSNQLCTSSGTITSVSLKDVSGTQVYPFCAQPHGNPGEECQIIINPPTSQH